MGSEMCIRDRYSTYFITLTQEMCVPVVRVQFCVRPRLVSIICLCCCITNQIRRVFRADFLENSPLKGGTHSEYDGLENISSRPFHRRITRGLHSPLCREPQLRNMYVVCGWYVHAYVRPMIFGCVSMVCVLCLLDFCVTMIFVDGL